MSKNVAVDVDAISRLFSYSPDSGRITWRVINNQHCGKRAGSIKADRNGKRYVRVRVGKRIIAGHVIAWFFHTGDWLPGQIDHINGDGTDNRIENLRLASNAENMKNKRLMENNTSGFCGVVYHSRDKVWEARININGRRVNLGRFRDRSGAIAARIKANEQHGFHKNHGQRRPL